MSQRAVYVGERCLPFRLALFFAFHREACLTAPQIAELTGLKSKSVHETLELAVVNAILDRDGEPKKGRIRGYKAGPALQRLCDRVAKGSL